MKSLSELGIEYYLAQASSDEPTIEPIATSDVEAHTYASSDDLTLIGSYIKAARKYVEGAIPGGRALVQQTFTAYLSRFPLGAEALLLPRPPLLAITSIGYHDGNNSTQTMASSDYVVIAPTKAQARVIPQIDTNWPATKERPDSVKIVYTAGYGTTGEHVPETLRLATKMLAAHWYANREAVIVGKPSKPIELGIKSLLATEGWGFYG